MALGAAPGGMGAPGCRRGRAGPGLLRLPLLLAAAAGAGTGLAGAAGSDPPTGLAGLCEGWAAVGGRESFSAMTRAELAARCAGNGEGGLGGGLGGKRALQQVPQSSRVAVTNEVAGDGSSQVRVYGYAADGTAVEGLRVGSGGAEVFLGAAGSPLSQTLGPLQTLLAYEIAVPAPGVVALSGANVLYVQPEIRFSHLGQARFNAPMAASEFAWTVSSGDPKVAAEWDTASGRLKLTSSAAAALGSENFSSFNATISLQASAPGLLAASAQLQVLVRPLDHSDFSLMDPGIGMRRNHGSAFTCGGRIYLVGCGSQCYMSKRMEAFDPTTRSWWRLPDVPDQVNGRAGCLDGRVHVLGGTQEVSEFSYDDAGGFFHFRYDPAVGIWETLPRFPGDYRSYGMVVGLAGVVYAFGDYDKQNELWGYDSAAMAWDKKADHPNNIWGACGAAWGGQLYVFGGRGRDENNSWRNWERVYSFDPASNAWTRRSDAPVALGGTNTACATDESTERIYVAALANNANQELYAYDPAGDVWHTLPVGGPVDHYRINSHLVSFLGRLYYLGGARLEPSGYEDYSEKVDVR